ncbi:putative 2-aminoethylphosphonate ABC transporter permease subunit [Clostridium lundense]|uniref:putative 2-aminoethylphosphonate ABC transporter permease subunit n=1 Tax=Clostridium lundense TaxID=319475 RepID=UPI000484C709|nr:putative 2-aminoethylphosphonate ABC transporter permease subunit [Clostridium lundense]
MKKWNKRKILRNSFLLSIILFLAISMLLPMLALFKKSFYMKRKFVGINNFKRVINDTGFLQALSNSFNISLVVAIITLILAFLFAYGIARTNIKGKKFFKTVAILPLFAPTMVYGIALIYIFGSKGILTTGFLGLSSNLKVFINIYGRLGIVTAETLYIFPSVYLIILAGFNNIDYSLYEAAEVVGTSGLRQWYTIKLQQMKNSIINAFFTAFIMCFTDFGIPKVIGGSYDTIALRFYQQVVGQNQIGKGAVIAILFLIPSCIYFIIYTYIKRNTYNNKQIRPYIIKKNIFRDMFFTIYNVIMSFNIIIVFIILFLSSMIKNWPYDLSITFKYYNIKTIGTSLLDIYRNTIFVSFMVAFIGTAIVFTTAYIVERYKEFSQARAFLHFVSSLPLAIPGMVIGLSYLLFFNKRWNIFNCLYGTLAILIVANIIHFFSVPFFTISDNLKKIDKGFEEVSECMGIPWYITLIKVILPNSIFSILKSFEYYFINSMVTISAVSFLYTSKTKLASIEILNKSDSGDIAIASAIAVTIVIINLVLKFIFNRIESKLYSYLQFENKY